MADDWESLLDEPEVPVKADTSTTTSVNGQRGARDTVKSASVDTKKTASKSKEHVEEDSLARKLRMANLARDSDLDSAADLFGIPRENGNAGKAAPGAHESLPLSELFNPNSIDDFEVLGDALIQQLLPLEKRPGFVFFMEKLIRAIGPSLAYEDSRQLSSVLTIISNERLRADKESAKTKKKGGAASKKATIKVGAALDDAQYSDYDDYDE